MLNIITKSGVIMEFSKAYAYLNQYRSILTKQQYKTFLGQAKSGNVEAMIKGLNKFKNK